MAIPRRNVRETVVQKQVDVLKAAEAPPSRASKMELAMQESEVVVIGGGIAGASAAYHLAQHGHDVTLLERGAIASGASGVNAGGIGGTGWGRIPDLEAHLTMGSLEIFRAMQLDLGIRTGDIRK